MDVESMMMMMQNCS